MVKRCKCVGGTLAGSGEYKTYYETGSLRAGTHKIHIRKYKTKKRAVEAARRLSRASREWVAIMRGGFEVGACYNGKCEGGFE